MLFDSMRLLTSDVRLSTSGASPVIVTDWPVAPSSSVTSRPSCSPVVSVTPWRTYLRKPACSTDTTYAPIGRFCRWKKPVELVRAPVWTPVSAFVATTTACGTTPPCWSVTMPLILARLDCARQAAPATHRQEANHAHLTLNIASPLYASSLLYTHRIR